MRVLVDTSVWSVALRRRAPRAPTALGEELATLVRDGRVAMMGPVRQELLSGVRERAQFERLRSHLAAFPDLALETADYELAADFCNRCQAAGIQGSHTDFLICAVTVRRKLAIFTTDGDFGHYTRALPLRLYQASGAP